MSAHDENVYNYSLSSESETRNTQPFLEKKVLYLNDNNSSSDYSMNEIIFESTSMSNNGKWCDYRDSYINIPITATAVSTVDLTTQEIVFKSSALSIIHSLSITYNNKVIVAPTENICSYLIFQEHETMSLDDIRINKHSKYRKDESSSWTYDGIYGVSNNDTQFNDSMTANRTTSHLGNQENLLSLQNIKDSSNEYFEFTARTRTYHFNCIIDMKKLLFFNKIPLTRGSNITLKLRLNQFSCWFEHHSEVVEVAADPLAVPPVIAVAAVPEYVTTSNTNYKGSSSPIMFAGEIPDNATIQMTVSVASKCRWYVPVYTFNKTFEDIYLQLGTKKIVYEDVYFKKITVNSGDSIQTMLTQALSNMKRVVIIPILNRDSNASLGISAAHSVFATEPSTTTPCRLSEFNLKLSGDQLYPQNLTYSYEHYLSELNMFNGLNSNLVTGSSSGGINLEDFENNYGYITADLSRRYASDDATPQSLEVMFRNIGPKTIDYHCFIVYERTFVISLATGAELDAS